MILRTFIRRFCSLIREEVKSLPTQASVLEDNPKNDTEGSVLEPCSEDISHVAPYLRPSFNFAAYVNKSKTLQELVKLGVNLHKLEKKAEVAPYILQLDLDRDIRSHLMFLSDLNVQDFGYFITQNPFFFKEDIETLKIRVNYLQSKKFSSEMITRIVENNPKWLAFSTQEIDSRLGFFQKQFALSGNEVRQLTCKNPKVVTYDLEKIKVNIFAIKEEMGLTANEMKEMILKIPKLLVKNQKRMLKTFEYTHRNMAIPLETIVKMPEVLTCRDFRLQQRHLFLKKLDKLQFNPKEPNYISLKSIISGTDAVFATEVAGSSIQTFNAFLKTL